MFNKIKKQAIGFLKSKRNIFCLVLVLFLGIFIFGNFASASIGPVGKAVAVVLGHLTQLLVSFLGLVLTLLMFVLVKVASFNQFIDTPAVTNGWVIVRDLCNMFFILILLVIAFATILRAESYNAKKLLPKLLIMAVLINFSKTICGLIIDFAQVIMLSFVSSFRELGGAKLVETLGIKDLMNFKETEGDIKGANEVTLINIIGAYILALIFVLISIVVIGTMLMVLIMRIVMLWIYIVLSPLAYLLAAFPAGQKYASQWWSEFSKNVIIGPVLAFFIWLAFISLGNVKSQGEIMKGFGDMSGAPGAITTAGTPDHFIKFFIAIGMLLGGLMVSQQIGGIVGGIAGKGMGMINKSGEALKKWGLRKTKEAALGVAGTGLKVAGGGIKAVGDKYGSKSVSALGKVGSEMGKGIHKNIAKAKEKRRGEFFKKIGLGSEDAQLAVQELANSRLGKGVSTAAKVAGGLTLAAATGGLGLVPGLVGATAGMGYGAGHVVSSYFSSKGKKKVEARKKTDDDVEEVEKKKMNKDINFADAKKRSEISRIDKEKENIENATIITAQANDYSNEDAYKKAETDKLNKEKADVEKNYQGEVGQARKIYEDSLVAHGGKFKIDHELNLKTKDIEVKLDSGAITVEEAQKERSEASAKHKSSMDEYNYGKGPERWLKDYHPNKVTMDATKESLKEYRLGEDRVNTLAGGANAAGFSRGALYSESGQTDGQKKFFERLISMDQKSIKALEQINVNFKAVLEKQGRGENLSSTEKQAVEGWKMGIAAFQKGGGNTAPLNEVINIINQIDTGDNSKRTVDDYVPTVIENKK